MPQPRGGQVVFNCLVFHNFDYPFLIGALISFGASVSLLHFFSPEYGLFFGL